MGIVLKSIAKSKIRDTSDWEYTIVEPEDMGVASRAVALAEKSVPKDDRRRKSKMDSVIAAELEKHTFKGREVNRQEAREYIKKHGLVLVYQDELGKVYDKPDSPFRERFKGWGGSYVHDIDLRYATGEEI